MSGGYWSHTGGTAEAVVEDINHILRFSGQIRFVGKDGDDGNDGLSPTSAFLTIGAAKAASSPGDAIVTKAGVYAESVVMDLVGLEFWPEIGTVLAPASGTPLTLSANYCKVWNTGGALIVDPAANETGVLVTGGFCYVTDVRAKADSVADIGFDVRGNGAVLTNCRCASPLVAAFKIQGDKVLLNGCCTGGEVANDSIGFWITNECDKFRLRDCGSQGHAGGGFYVDDGCTNGGIANCYSGAGDGRWRGPADNSTVWANFSFDDEVYKEIEFDASGGASVNLFRVYGTVLITAFYADVEEALAADIGNGYVNLYDGTVAVDVTDSPGPSFNSLPVGSYAHKIDDATVQIAIAQSDQVRLYEDATKFGQDPHFQVTAKNGVASYIRFTYSGTGTSGKLHWHCRWEPLTEDGFVEEV